MSVVTVLILSLVTLEVTSAPLRANKTRTFVEDDNSDGLVNHDHLDQRNMMKQNKDEVVKMLHKGERHRKSEKKSQDDQNSELKKHVDKFEMRRAKLSELDLMHMEHEADNMEEQNNGQKSSIYKQIFKPGKIKDNEQYQKESLLKSKVCVICLTILSNSV